MNHKQKFFLDTTIQIDRLFEISYRKQKIRKELARSECYTCTLVLREFKFRVIYTCINLFDILNEYDSDPDVLTVISRQFTVGIMSMMLKIYAEVKREAGLQNRFDKELALETLRAYITRRLLLRFSDILKEQESDLTKCELAQNMVQESNGKFNLETRCNRKVAKCNLPEIYQNNEEHLKRIKELIDSGRKLKRRERIEFGKIIKVYSKVLEHQDWNIVKGQQNCDYLADLTILIESPSDSVVYSTNFDYEYLFNRLCFPDKKATKIEKY
jgi:predicted SpoU family rRNA methylase